MMLMYFMTLLNIFNFEMRKAILGGFRQLKINIDVIALALCIFSLFLFQHKFDLFS